MLWILVSLLWLEGAFCISYQGHALYRGIPVTSRSLWFFGNLTQNYNVVFWREPSKIYRPTEFSIARHNIPALLFEAKMNGAVVSLLIEDIQKAFDLQTVARYVRRNMDSFNWKSYYKLGDIYSWYQDLVKTRPGEVELIEIGKTYEQRPIYVVRVHLLGAKPRSRVLIEGGIHAREWVSTSMATYLLNEIVSAEFSSDEDLKNIAYSYEWHFIPVLNPDGFSYTQTVDRLWRKNRNILYNGTGVDLNRNFDIKFNSVGCSYKPNDETYCGTMAFSEQESRAWANYLTNLPKFLPIEYYIAFHAYGQYFIIPYAFTHDHLDNYDEVENMGMEAAKRIESKHGTIYAVGNAFDTVGYLVSGVSSSWAKKQFEIPYVFTFELPDEGVFGFALPPHLIERVVTETMEGLKYLLTPRGKNVSKVMISSVDEYYEAIIPHVSHSGTAVSTQLCTVYEAFFCVMCIKFAENA